MTIQVFSEIIESNGKTIRQNNLEIEHKIPVGTLIEIKLDDEDENQEENGLRLYVTGHTRDCDGTPLYALSFKPNAFEEFEKRKKDVDERIWEKDDCIYSRGIALFYLHLASGALLNNYPESCLLVIREPNKQ